MKEKIYWGKYGKRFLLFLGIVGYLFMIYSHYASETPRFADELEFVAELFLWTIIGLIGFSLLYKRMVREEEANKSTLADSLLQFYEKRNVFFGTNEQWSEQQKSYRFVEPTALAPEEFRTLGFDYRQGLVLLSKEEHAGDAYRVKIPFAQITHIRYIEEAVAGMTPALIGIHPWGVGVPQRVSGSLTMHRQLYLYTENPDYPFFVLCVTSPMSEEDQEDLVKKLANLEAEFADMGIPYLKNH